MFELLRFDCVNLSQLQFGLLSCVHIVFMPLNIGFAALATLMQAMNVLMGAKNHNHEFWEQGTKFWLKMLAISYQFALITLIPIIFSLIINWQQLVVSTGTIFGPFILCMLFTMLILEMFITLAKYLAQSTNLRANFLSRNILFLGVLLVITALTMLYTLPLVAMQAMMHHPVGIEFDFLNNYGTIVSFTKILSNNIQHMFWHNVFISYIAISMIAAAISAHYIMKHKQIAFAINLMKTAIFFGLFSLLCTYSTGINLYNQQEQEKNATTHEQINENRARIKNGMLGVKAMRNLRKEYTAEDKNLFLMHKQDIPYALLLRNFQPAERLVGTTFETVCPTLEEISQKEINDAARSTLKRRVHITQFVTASIISAITLLILLLLLYKAVRKKIVDATFILKVTMALFWLPLALVYINIIAKEIQRAPWLIYNIVPGYMMITKLNVQFVALSFLCFLAISFMIILFAIARFIECINSNLQNVTITTSSAKSTNKVKHEEKTSSQLSNKNTNSTKVQAIATQPSALESFAKNIVSYLNNESSKQADASKNAPKMTAKAVTKTAAKTIAETSKKTTQTKPTKNQAIEKNDTTRKKVDTSKLYKAQLKTRSVLKKLKKQSANNKPTRKK